MKRLAMFAGMAVLLAACGGNAQEPDRSSAAETQMKLEITSFDFGYKLPTKTVGSGPLRMELTNEGVQPHQALLYRLNDGVDIETFFREVTKDDTSLPKLAASAGGMTRYAATDDTVVTEGPVVEPGSYAIVCFVRDQSLETNKNHAELGMIAPLEVI